MVYSSSMDFNQQRINDAIRDYKNYLNFILGTANVDQVINSLSALGQICAQEAQRQMHKPGMVSPMDMVLQNLVALTTISGTMAFRLTELTKRVAVIEKQLKDMEEAEDDK